MKIIKSNKTSKYNKILKSFILLLSISGLTYCSQPAKKEPTPANDAANMQDSLFTETAAEEEEIPENIEIEIVKDFTYDKYTLDDTYPYGKGTRSFQWNKIKDGLTRLTTAQPKAVRWGILQNRRNVNGEAALVNKYKRNEYNRVIDTFGTERYQAVPLYLLTDSVKPFRYGKDGTLVKLIDEGDKYVRCSTVYFDGEWITPKKYVKIIEDPFIFDKVIFVDRKNQNITALEKKDSKWLVRSMNPATTGIHKPPLKHETPLGIYVMQEKKPKMLYYVDHTTDIGGYTPHASRFCQGGYIHGIPVNLPRTEEIEYSASLGTTPRSHMCVRTATSHAKYIYEWAPIEKSLVYVIE